MAKHRNCSKCDARVEKETKKGLRKEYPFYCPVCDENLYRFETYKKQEERKMSNVREFNLTFSDLNAQAKEDYLMFVGENWNSSMEFLPIVTIFKDEEELHNA